MASACDSLSLLTKDAACTMTSSHNIETNEPNDLVAKGMPPGASREYFGVATLRRLMLESYFTIELIFPRCARTAISLTSPNMRCANECGNFTKEITRKVTCAPKRGLGLSSLHKRTLCLARLDVSVLPDDHVRIGGFQSMKKHGG